MKYPRKKRAAPVIQGTATQLMEIAVQPPTYVKELARVDSFFLGREAHGVFTLIINFDSGSWKPSFGNVPFDTYEKNFDKRVGHARGIDFMLRIMEIFGVDEFKRIVGEPVFLLIEKPNSGLVLGLEAPPWRQSKRFILEDWVKYWDEQ